MADRRLLYLIDANAYVYRAFYALPPLTSPTGAPTNAVYGFTTMLLKLLRDRQPTHIAAVFDAPGPTFRREMFPEYKANRAAMPDEMKAQLPAVREVAEACHVPILTVPGVEADDVIATLAERFGSAGVDLIVVTADKDLMQLVNDRVRLWDTMRDRWIDADAVQARFGVAPEEVVEVLGLMGDASDNIPGVRGIGEKTAQSLIQKFHSVDNLLANLDVLEGDKSIRGAKKVASLLRDGAEQARLSRTLALVRRDVPLECGLDDLQFAGLDIARLRPLFSQLGFQSLLKSAAPVAAETCDVRRGLSATEWADWAKAARQAGVVGWGQVGEGAARANLASLSGQGVVAAGAGDDGPGRDKILEVLSDREILKVVHDLKRELLAAELPTAIEVQPCFDTMIASYVLEAAPSHRVEDLASAVLGRGIGDPARSADAATAAVGCLPDIRAGLAPRLDALGVRKLFDDIEMPLVRVLTAMERRGVLLDVGALAEIGSEIARELLRLEKDIYELAGGEFNIASPVQLRDILFERLNLSRKGVKKGKTGLSTDVDVLTKLAEEHPLPAKILQHRALAKVQSTYIEALPAAVRPGTGRLHTTFNQAVAVTGRLSSSDPNLQNIPIRTDYGRRIRAAFVAAPGFVLVGADYSQIELRVLAHLSEDPALVRAFLHDEDIHTATAAEVFGVLKGTVSAEMRRVAKVINFGIIYGMGPQRLARELSIPLAQADRYIRDYFERYAGVKKYMARIREEAHRNGYVSTLMGRRRSLPDLQSRDRALVQAAERTATNTPIQGSAADLIKMAMVAIDQRLTDEQVSGGLILQVHDELLLEVPQPEAEGVLAIVRQEMEGVFPLRVPLKVEAGIGADWAKLH